MTPSPVARVAAASAGVTQPHHPSLEEALHDLLEHAAAADGQAAQALEAFVAAAGAMEEELQVDRAQSEGDDSEEDEGELAALQATAGVAAVLEQLQQQAAAVADGAVAAAEQAAQPAAGEELGGGSSGSGLGAAATAIQQHNRRLWAARSAGGLLWSLLGSGIAQWEVANRDPAGGMPSWHPDGAGWCSRVRRAAAGCRAGHQGSGLRMDAMQPRYRTPCCFPGQLGPGSLLSPFLRHRCHRCKNVPSHPVGRFCHAPT